jgi:predicted alpha/beta-fold hydrolase
VETTGQKQFGGCSFARSAMEWLGHAKISFTHSPNPLALQTKDDSSTDLLKVCEESTPPCHLNPLLFNGHLQTMFTAIKKDGPPIHYKRKIFEAEDPAYEGTFAVDFVAQPSSESDDTLPPRTTYFSDEEFEMIGSLDDRPMLVTLHGLSGGSYEIYLKHILAPLTEEAGERQWEACVINSRGCVSYWRSKIFHIRDCVIRFVSCIMSRERTPYAPF